MLEIETFEADGTVNEIKKMGKMSSAKGFLDIQRSQRKKEKAAAKQSSTITINKFTVEQGTKVIGEK